MLDIGVMEKVVSGLLFKLLGFLWVPLYSTLLLLLLALLACR